MKAKLRGIRKLKSLRASSYIVSRKVLIFHFSLDGIPVLLATHRTHGLWSAKKRRLDTRLPHRPDLSILDQKVTSALRWRMTPLELFFLAQANRHHQRNLP